MSIADSERARMSRARPTIPMYLTSLNFVFYIHLFSGTNTNASRLVRRGFLNGLRVVCMFVCTNMCVMLFFQSIPYQRTNESLASFVSLCLFLRNTFCIPLCKVNHSEFNRWSLIEYQSKSNVSIYPLKLLPDYVQHNNDHHS